MSKKSKPIRSNPVSVRSNDKTGETKLKAVFETLQMTECDNKTYNFNI